MEFLDKVIDELPIAPGERIWDSRELAQNLIDYVDEDDERQRGGPENAWYESRTPPYEAPNQPLRTIDELSMVEGFTGVLVEGIRPYATVHPRLSGTGINLNTAPPHVLVFKPSSTARNPAPRVAAGSSASVWHRSPFHAARHAHSFAPGSHWPL